MCNASASHRAVHAYLVPRNSSPSAPSRKAECEEAATQDEGRECTPEEGLALRATGFPYVFLASTVKMKSALEDTKGQCIVRDEISCYEGDIRGAIRPT